MRSFVRVISVSAMVAMGIWSAGPATAAQGLAGTGRAPAGVWRSVRLPRTVIEPAALYSVSAVSRTSAWAAGQEHLGTGSRGLIVHWNGLRWVKEQVPRSTVSVNVISAVSPGDAWALGIASSGVPVILHRLRGAWRDVPVPPDLRGWNVDTIAAGGLGTAWVWGYNGSKFGFLLERWNGRAWRRTTVPFLDWGDMVALKPVGAQVWTAGRTTTGLTQVLHWDGRSWSQIIGPRGTFDLNDVLVRRPGDIWAAGDYCLSAQPGAGCTNGGGQIAHWNGTRWNRVIRQPAVGSATTISAGRLGQPEWAGLDVLNPASIVYDHFDGRNWSTVPATPLRGATGVTSFTARIPGTGSTWAVGYIRNGSTLTAFTQINNGP